MKKYERYEPTKWEARIDSAIRLISPRTHLRRIVDREKASYFRYLAAYSNTGRENTNQAMVGETMRGAREKRQVMLNAMNLVDNSGLCSSLLRKIQMYICGTLRFQSLCGNRTIANEYEDYMRMKSGKSLDFTGRFGLRQMCMMDINAILLKGDVGTNVVRQGDDITLQGIEADRIGNMYNWSISNSYVSGLNLDENGVLVSADIYYRDRASGTYSFDQTIPFRDKRGLPRFLFLMSPIDYDNYRGVSVFKTAIDNATYIENMRQYELQALMWAASQSGVYHTNSGTLPEALPFDRITPLVDASGNVLTTYQVRPNTVTAIGVGEDVAMFQHDRPSPNVVAMVKETIRDICNGVGVSFEFGWDMSGLSGPAVRGVSAMDARGFEMWQWMLQENKLDPVAGLILGNGIAIGDIPFHPLWNKWRWQFPAKSTIDASRDSQSNIEEIAAGINTGARVCADDNMDVDEVQDQLGREQQTKLELAIQIAQKLTKQTGEPIDWREVYNYMFPPRKGTAVPGLTAPTPGAMGSAVPGTPGGKSGKPTTDGVEIDAPQKQSGNGKSQNGKRGRPVRLRFQDNGELEIWYSPDQERDERGRFADEGKGGGAGKVGGAAIDISKPALGHDAPVPATGSSYSDADALARQEAYMPGDVQKYNDLKKQWATVNNSLLDNIKNPDSPEAKEKLGKLMDIVKQMHELHADPGGISDIGLPGGPRDVIVIGAGPGGMAAATMAATDGLDVKIVDKAGAPGGQSRFSSRIENYPGFPVGIAGEDLARNMWTQAMRTGAEGELGVGVNKLSYDPTTGFKTVSYDNGKSERARSVIIAGGVQFRRLPPFPGSESKSVIYGDSFLQQVPQMKGKSVVVIGGSNGSAQAALGAAKAADHVYVLARKPIGTGMSDYQVSALRSNPKITIDENDEIAKVFQDEHGEATHIVTKSGKEFPAKYVGVFVGSAANTDYVPAEVKKVTERGPNTNKIITNDDLETAVPGVFAVGDVRAGGIQRIGGAVGEGQHAERNAFNYFAKRLGVNVGKAADISMERAKKHEIEAET